MALCTAKFSHLSPLPSQGHIKRDPPGYQDEFELQWRHFKACLDLLHLSPDQPSPGLGELVTFVSQVASCYPALTKSFTGDLMATLDQHHMLMEPVLRHTIVKALILIRNRGQVRRWNWLVESHECMGD